MSTSFNVATRNAALNARVSYWGGSATAEFWNGTKPSGFGTPTGTKLATLSFGTTAVTDANGGAAGGVNNAQLTFGGFTQNSTSHVAGTPTFMRVKKSDGTIVADIDVGSGAASIAFTGSIANGQNITGSLVYTEGNA